ncbi:MAG: hypothetical protein K9L19_04570 [Desulfarculaceae bacterium]|nr:hypothetical protein [Desulfarculaceae bacterium]MCF8046793.1 hypothetical protein [Desulfarculaceae bacterium]MCF8123743.1 hypothetical protein [Desulfarculaceae bacterium]
MLLELTNARVEIERLPELRAQGTIQAAGRTVHLLGRPGWRVDYGRLDYDDDPVAVERALEEALTAWLADPARLPGLAALSGAYLILVCRDGVLEHVLTSDELGNSVYWWAQQGRLVISDSWRSFAQGRDLLAWDAYDPDQLAWFSRKKTCAPGRTYLKGLGRLSVATLYQVDGAALRPLAAVCPDPPDNSRSFTWNDLYSVVGRRLGPGPYSLCYSTGIDSHFLLMRYTKRIEQVLTIYMAAPYQDQERSLEAAAALINALEQGKPYAPVGVDFAEPVNRQYLSDAVDRDPFAAHYSCSMYQAFDQASCGQILSGQNADTMQFFALTSRMGPKDLLFKSPVSPQKPLTRVAYRVEAARSFGGPRPGGMVNSRMLCGLGGQMLCLTGPRGYWPILHFKRIHNMTTGNTALFRNASRYFGKPVRFPYLEPLVFYVSAYFRRPLTDILNPKGHLKRQYHYLRHSQIPQAPPQGKPFADSPLFAWAAERMEELAPELKQKVDATVMEPMGRVVLYRLAALAGNGRLC